MCVGGVLGGMGVRFRHALVLQHVQVLVFQRGWEEAEVRWRGEPSGRAAVDAQVPFRTQPYLSTRVYHIGGNICCWRSMRVVEMTSLSCRRKQHGGCSPCSCCSCCSRHFNDTHASPTADVNSMEAAAHARARLRYTVYGIGTLVCALPHSLSHTQRPYRLSSCPYRPRALPLCPTPRGPIGQWAGGPRRIVSVGVTGASPR